MPHSQVRRRSTSAAFAIDPREPVRIADSVHDAESPVTSDLKIYR